MTFALLLAIALVFYACKKTDTQNGSLSQQDNVPLSLAEAKSFFGRTVKEISPESISASAPSKFFNIPIWDSAVYEKGANGISYWKVPLKSKEKTVRHLTIFNRDKKQDQIIMPDPWLLIYQDSTHKMQMLVTQSIPSKRTGKGSSFTGEVKMYDWKGNFDHAFVYQDGKKQKLVTSTKSRRYKATSPNARWEFQCIEYTDCEFQAECVGSTSTGMLVIVAFALVRTDNGGCYWPSDDPYASTPLGYDWNCSGWQHTNTQPAVECSEVWVDDWPDPEPSWDGMEDGYPYGWWEDESWLDVNFPLTVDKGYQTLNSEEKKLVKQYPAQALAIRKNVAVAVSETLTRFGTNDFNGRSDAFRHAYFLALNTLDVGSEIAKLFGDAHESNVPAAYILEKNMDLHNNQVGIDIAIGYWDRATIGNEVWDAYQGGELWYLSPLDFTVDDHGIIPGQTKLIPTNQ